MPPDNFCDVQDVIQESAVPGLLHAISAVAVRLPWGTTALRRHRASRRVRAIQTGVTDLHAQWSAGQDSMAVAPAFALIVGCIAVGNHDTAKTYLTLATVSGGQSERCSSASGDR